MIHVLLATWLATQQWQWDKPPVEDNVTKFRIRWSATGTIWCYANMVELDAATHCGVAAGCDSDTVCCGDVPMPPFSPAWLVVTAVNSSNIEGPTEHGDVLVCP